MKHIPLELLKCLPSLTRNVKFLFVFLTFDTNWQGWNVREQWLVTHAEPVLPNKLLFGPFQKSLLPQCGRHRNPASAVGHNYRSLPRTNDQQNGTILRLNLIYYSTQLIISQWPIPNFIKVGEGINTHHPLSDQRWIQDGQLGGCRGQNWYKRG